MRTSYLALFVLSAYLISSGAQASPTDTDKTVPAAQVDISEQTDKEILKAANTTAEARIIDPVDGATIKAVKKNKIQYKVIGDEGVHGRLYVDGKKTALLRDRTGSYKLKNLAAGQHKLCIVALNGSHKAVGAQQCITVTAQ